MLVVTGVVANMPMVAAAWLWARHGPRLGAGVCAALALLAVALDVAERRMGRPRPFAVHRQVPQGWGHRRGPWAAALRYGFRLGVGPATILNTWTWWAAVVSVVSFGPAWAFAGAVTFVGVRSVVTLGVVADVRDGVAMAGRSRRIGGLEAAAFRGTETAVILAVAVSVVRRAVS